MKTIGWFRFRVVALIIISSSLFWAFSRVYIPISRFSETEGAQLLKVETLGDFLVVFNPRGFIILNTTDISSPQEVSRLDNEDGFYTDLEVSGNFILLVNKKNSTLEFYDASDINKPTLGPIWRPPSNPVGLGLYSVLVHENTAYAYQGFPNAYPTAHSYLYILDISNPHEIIQIAVLEDAGIPEVLVEDRLVTLYGYVPEIGVTFSVFDVSNPSRPRRTWSENLQDSKIIRVFESDGLLVVYKGTIIEIWQAGDGPGGFVETARLEGIGGFGLEIRGDFLYSVSVFDFRVVDISNPQYPKLVKILPLRQGESVQYIQDFIILSDKISGIYFFKPLK